MIGTTGWVRRWSLAGGVGLLAVWAAAAAHAELVIDSFMTPQKAAFAARGSLGYAQSVVTAPEVLGGERDVQVSRQSLGAGSLVINAVGEELLSCSSDGTSFVACAVEWDGMDGVFGLDPMGLGGVDLTQGGANAGFRVPLSVDVASTLDIKVTSASDATVAEHSIALAGGDTTLVERFFPFTDFPNPEVFADAGSVSLVLTAQQAGLDAQIGTITAPEPAHTVLTALGVLSWLVLRRRAALSRS
jgi:hypothetical protein